MLIFGTCFRYISYLHFVHIYVLMPCIIIIIAHVSCTMIVPFILNEINKSVDLHPTHETVHTMFTFAFINPLN
jgi:hypothetical protein